MPYPPSAYGLLAYSIDPMSVQGNAALNGLQWFTRLKMPDDQDVITNLWAAVYVGGVWDGVTTPNQIGLYDDTGTLIDATADNGNLWTVAGWRGGPLAGGPQSGFAGAYIYLVWIIRGYGGGNPQMPFPAAANDTTGVFASDQVGGGGNRRAAYQAAGAALPASFNPATVGTRTGYLTVVGVS